MLNLLVVEDDEYFRAAVKTVLQDQKWNVTEAVDGKAAREIIKVSSPFDLIISDIQMPFLTGVELLQWVKQNKSMPFILMTGFALVMETQKAHELGADDFLAKPFATEELLNLVRRICSEKLNIGGQKNFPVEPVDYCKVSLEEFVSAGKLNFDVHVKLGSRFVKIGRKGDGIPVDRIHIYKDKGLRHLYVRKEDFRSLVSFNLNLARTVAATDKVGAEKKANFMRYTGEVLLEKAFVAGVDEESFSEAKDFITTSMDVLTDDQDCFDLLQSFNAYSDHLYAHSLCVSVYAVMIAKEMGWTSSGNLFKASLSGIFHDIGKKEIDREILFRPRPLLTHNERKVIETHAQRGREILLALKNMPSEVVEVAYQHHEDNLSTGYPRGIEKHSIHPYAQLIRVANLFAEFSLKSPNSAGMAGLATIEHMNIHYRESCSTEVFRALCRLYNFRADGVA